MTPADKLEALLPCPFCGADVSMWNKVVTCRNCCAVTSVAVWNTRTAIRAEMGEAVPVYWMVGNEVFKSEAEAIEEIQQWGPSGSIAVPLYATPPATVPVEAPRFLVGWVQKHAQHADDCPLWVHNGTEKDCACGLREARKAAALIAAQEKK